MKLVGLTKTTLIATKSPKYIFKSYFVYWFLKTSERLKEILVWSVKSFVMSNKTLFYTNIVTVYMPICLSARVLFYLKLFLNLFINLQC